jgi:1,4-dihydroxy-2-naphthoyl-CoA synthase
MAMLDQNNYIPSIQTDKILDGISPTSLDHQKLQVIMSKPNFELPEPSGQYCVLSYPAPGVLLVRLNRPKDLNCINQDGHAELDKIWSWLDAEPTLNVGIITGIGRAFCAGADLKGKPVIRYRRTHTMCEQ